MADSRMRQLGRIKKDRISMLPRNLQETILCCLPMRDAVRTSILSTKWRHCWTKVPHLAFDEDIFLGPEFYNFRQCHDAELNAHKFVGVVNKVLLLHDGPLLTFSITFPKFSFKYQIIHNYIDQWIPLLSRKGIKELALDDCFLGEFMAHNFSSLELTHLRLANFFFPYTPAFGGLTNLRNLELIEVAISGQSMFDCPVLENLTLLGSEGLLLSHTRFRAPNLKCLHQRYLVMTSEYSLVGFENLKEFSYRLSNEPKIQTDPETSNVVKVFGSLHKIEKISIAKCFIKYLAAGGSPNRLSKPLPYLKTLSITCITLSCLSEVSCLLCLIRSAPNLCKLHISASLEPDEDTLKDEDYEDCSVDNLEIVTFSNFKGLTGEMKLVKFLLARSPLLKTMYINRDSKMAKDVAFKMLEEMLEFSRASSRAQIKHLKHPFDAVDYGPWVDKFDLYDD